MKKNNCEMHFADLALPKKEIIAFLLLLFSFALAQEAPLTVLTRRLEPVWERALGGDAAASPSVFRDRIFVLSVDRSITALTETGGFVWRRALKNRPAPFFCVLQNGLICTFGRNGEMSVFSANGTALWIYNGKTGSLPVLNPYEGSDGRLFILYEDELVCLASNGLQKWRSSIDGSGALLLSGDGRGNALVVRQDGAIVPVSAWGRVSPAVQTGLGIRGAIALEGAGVALFSPGSGSSWKITALDFNLESGSAEPALLWERDALPPFAAALCSGETLYYAGEDGSFFTLSSLDGSQIAQSNIPESRISGASMLFRPGAGRETIILLAQELCAAFSADGKILWQAIFSKPLLNPVFTESGFAVSSPQDAIIAAFRVDSSPPGQRQQAVEEELASSSSRPEEYAVFSGKSRDYGNPLASASFGYFEDVQKKISEGNLGEDEIDILRRLSEILNNDTGLLSTSYNAPQRSLAASTLGQMGTEEARSALLRAARTETDPTVAAGILNGLASLGPERGRSTLDAVLFISQRHRRAEEVDIAVCNALYSIAQVSYGDVASEAASIIFSYTGQQYTGSVRRYAMQLFRRLAGKT